MAGIVSETSALQSIAPCISAVYFKVEDLPRQSWQALRLAQILDHMKAFSSSESAEKFELFHAQWEIMIRELLVEEGKKEWDLLRDIYNIDVRDSLDSGVIVGKKFRDKSIMIEPRTKQKVFPLKGHMNPSKDLYCRLSHTFEEVPLTGQLLWEYVIRPAKGNPGFNLALFEELILFSGFLLFLITKFILS